MRVITSFVHLVRAVAIVVLLTPRAAPDEGQQQVQAVTHDDATTSRDGQRVRILQGHTDIVWSASFDPEGRRVVTASDDGTARTWDPRGAGGDIDDDQLLLPSPLAGAGDPPSPNFRASSAETQAAP